MKALSKEALDEWEHTLNAGRDDSLSREDILFFLVDFDRLFDKSGFRQSESALLVERMALVPLEEVEAWKTALAKAIESDDLANHLGEERAALVVIVQQGSLFKGKTFDAALSKVLRDRVATIPKPVLQEAASEELLGNHSAMDATTAATALASYDRLFEGNTFQQAVWKEMTG